MFTIYALSCPTSSRTHYVGCTGRSLAVRVAGHLQDAKHQRRLGPLQLWLRSVGRPAARVLEQTAEFERAQFLERRWIATLRAAGAPLLNKRGGGGGFMPRAGATVRTGIRLNAGDIPVIAALKRSTGCAEDASIISQALRVFAAREGVTWEPTP